MPAALEGGCKLWGRKSRLANNHKKGPTDKRRINYADCQSDALTVKKNTHERMAPDEHKIGL